MKKFLKKASGWLRFVFGCGIMISLFGGGMTFFGYLVALVIGGETAAVICAVIYKTIIPVIVRLSTCMVLLGLLTMYLNGEVALTADKKKGSKHQGEI